jgi:hypothetical protein
MKFLLGFLLVGLLCSFHSGPVSATRHEYVLSPVWRKILAGLEKEKAERGQHQKVIYTNNFTLTLIGYIKIGDGGFGALNGCSISGTMSTATAVYSTTRTVLGQVGYGDILRDAGGVAVGGGGQGYGFFYRAIRCTNKRS